MAIRNVNTSAGAGVKYTKECDTSADFPNVPNNTVFFNRFDKVIYEKDATGSVTEYIKRTNTGTNTFLPYDANVTYGTTGYQYVEQSLRLFKYINATPTNEAARPSGSKTPVQDAALPTPLYFAEVSPTSVAVTIPESNKIYLDFTNGSDSLGQKGDSTRPFKTLSGVYSVANSGDYIIVKAGDLSNFPAIGKGTAGFITNIVFEAGSSISFANDAVNLSLSETVNIYGFGCTFNVANRVISSGANSFLKWFFDKLIFATYGTSITWTGTNTDNFQLIGRRLERANLSENFATFNNCIATFYVSEVVGGGSVISNGATLKMYGVDWNMDEGDIRLRTASGSRVEGFFENTIFRKNAIYFGDTFGLGTDSANPSLLTLYNVIVSSITQAAVYVYPNSSVVPNLEFYNTIAKAATYALQNTDAALNPLRLKAYGFKSDQSNIGNIVFGNPAKEHGYIEFQQPISSLANSQVITTQNIVQGSLSYFSFLLDNVSEAQNSGVYIDRNATFGAWLDIAGTFLLGTNRRQLEMDDLGTRTYTISAAGTLKTREFLALSNDLFDFFETQWFIDHINTLLYWESGNTGSNSGSNQLATTDRNGVIRVDCGDSTTGRAYRRFNNNFIADGFFVLGTKRQQFLFGFQIVQLSTGGDPILRVVGLANEDRIVGGNLNRGIFLRYTHSENSGAFRVGLGNGTLGYTNGANAVLAGKDYLVLFDINAAATSATVYIYNRTDNILETLTVTGTFPTGTANKLNAYFISEKNGSGTNRGQLDMDLFAFRFFP